MITAGPHTGNSTQFVEYLDSHRYLKADTEDDIESHTNREVDIARNKNIHYICLRYIVIRMLIVILNLNIDLGYYLTITGG